MKITEKGPLIRGVSSWMEAELYLNPQKISVYNLAQNADICHSGLALPEQIHGNKVQYIHSPGEFSEVDGLVTKTSDVTLILKVADCVPIFLFDPAINMIGLVHSGWRGTANGIVSNAIKTFLDKGSKVKDIHLFLGHSICQNCYAVDKEVAEHFSHQVKTLHQNGKWLVGLQGEIILQSLAEGVKITNITTSSVCSFEDLACHSYRRDGKDAGRMVAIMRILS